MYPPLDEAEQVTRDAQADDLVLSYRTRAKELAEQAVTAAPKDDRDLLALLLRADIMRKERDWINCLKDVKRTTLAFPASACAGSEKILTYLASGYHNWDKAAAAAKAELQLATSSNGTPAPAPAPAPLCRLALLLISLLHRSHNRQEEGSGDKGEEDVEGENAFAAVTSYVTAVTDTEGARTELVLQGVRIAVRAAVAASPDRPPVAMIKHCTQVRIFFSLALTIDLPFSFFTLVVTLYLLICLLSITKCTA